MRKLSFTYIHFDIFTSVVKLDIRKRIYKNEYVKMDIPKKMYFIPRRKCTFSIYD